MGALDCRVMGARDRRMMGARDCRLVVGPLFLRICEPLIVGVSCKGKWELNLDSWKVPFLLLRHFREAYSQHKCWNIYGGSFSKYNS